MPRITQRKSINIRSAHSIVHKSTLAHRCVLRVVSAFGSQKKAYQNFVTSRLQSRRFACALSRIAQRKSINIRSAHSRVHKSYLAHRCVLRVVSAFGFQKKAYQSFATSRLQSRRFYSIKNVLLHRFFAYILERYSRKCRAARRQYHARQASLFFYDYL